MVLKRKTLLEIVTVAKYELPITAQCFWKPTNTLRRIFFLKNKVNLKG